MEQCVDESAARNTSSECGKPESPRSQEAYTSSERRFDEAQKVQGADRFQR